MKKNRTNKKEIIGIAIFAIGINAPFWAHVLGVL